jgi:ACS family glucarate transporter-like MFS transporter
MRPTFVRYLVVAVTALAAMWMYIDRVCFSTLSEPIGAELGIAGADMSYVLGAFFFTYALFQIPVGSLADRYGPRVVLTACIVAWSLCTAATAVAGGAMGLIAVRLALGACEAGAYPAAAGLVRRWAAATERGFLSSMVAFGGRIGGAIAPVVTAFAAVTWLGNPGQPEWRGVFVLYGLAGLVVAVLFWVAARDHPGLHPLANAAEAARVPAVAPETGPRVPWAVRLLALVVSRNMWLFGATQFCINVGWVFLITSLPTYLKQVYAVPVTEVGTMQTVPLVASCVGMAFGGLFGDLSYRLFGRRWGRSLPLGLTLTLCAATYLIATQVSTAWGVVAALTVMAFLVDMSNPSIWAFAQDVGGRHVGAALGWGNMWGNFGAALSPILLVWINRRFGWDVAFLVCAGCFVLAAIAALSLNALVPVGGDEAAATRRDPERTDYED